VTEKNSNSLFIPKTLSNSGVEFICHVAKTFSPITSRGKSTTRKQEEKSKKFMKDEKLMTVMVGVRDGRKKLKTVFLNFATKGKFSADEKR
jgi:hypothetical protein